MILVSSRPILLSQWQPVTGVLQRQFSVKRERGTLLLQYRRGNTGSLFGVGDLVSISAKRASDDGREIRADLLRNVVLPRAQLFAIPIGLADLAIGISLSLGLFTRLGSVLAILRALTNILVAGGAGPDTGGFNVMLMAAGAIGLTTGAGRCFGLDRLLLARWPAVKILRLVA